MAPFDFSVNLRAAGWNVLVGDAKIGKMPRELWSERRAIISLDFLDGEREMLPYLPEEVDRGFGVVVVVDAQHPKSGRFVNGGELVEPPASPSDSRNELHIQLNRAARYLQRCIRRFWAGAVLLS